MRSVITVRGIDLYQCRRVAERELPLPQADPEDYTGTYYHWPALEDAEGMRFQLKL